MRKHARSKCEIRPYFVRASALCYKTFAYLLNVSIVLGDMVYDVAAEEERDVDITISYKNDNGELVSFVGIEVKGKNRPLDSITVEQLCMKFKDMKSVKRGGIVSASGYYKPAIKKALYHNVELYEFKDWELAQQDFNFYEEYNVWVEKPHFLYFFTEEVDQNDLSLFCNDSKVLDSFGKPLKNGVKTIRQLNRVLFNKASKNEIFKDLVNDKKIDEEIPINLNLHIGDQSIMTVINKKKVQIKMVKVTGTMKKVKKKTETVIKALVKYNDPNYQIGSAITELSNGMLVGFAIVTTEITNSLNLIWVSVPARLKAKIYRKKIK